MTPIREKLNELHAGLVRLKAMPLLAKAAAAEAAVQTTYELLVEIVNELEQRAPRAGE